MAQPDYVVGLEFMWYSFTTAVMQRSMNMHINEFVNHIRIWSPEVSHTALLHFAGD